MQNIWSGEKFVVSLTPWRWHLRNSGSNIVKNIIHHFNKTISKFHIAVLRESICYVFINYKLTLVITVEIITVVSKHVQSHCGFTRRIRRKLIISFRHKLLLPISAVGTFSSGSIQWMCDTNISDNINFLWYIVVHLVSCVPGVCKTTITVANQ